MAQEILRGAEEEEVPPVDAPHAPLAQEAEAVGPSSAEERGATANPGDRLDVQAPAAEHAEADRAQDGRGLEEALQGVCGRELSMTMGGRRGAKIRWSTAAANGLRGFGDLMA